MLHQLSCAVPASPLSMSGKVTICGERYGSDEAPDKRLVQDPALGDQHTCVLHVPPWLVCTGEEQAATRRATDGEVEPESNCGSLANFARLNKGARDLGLVACAGLT